MENKNGKGIFLGVVSVATLVVAIIGATFAFFSAQTSGNNGSIDFGSTQLGDNVLTLTEASNFKSTLVPVAAEDSNFARYVGLDTTSKTYCLDNDGNGICSVYQFTVTNSGTVAQPIYISMEPTTNGFENLYYAIYGDADANISDHTVATGFTKATTASTDGGHGTLAAQTTASNTDLIRTAQRLDGTTEVQLTELNTTLAANDGSVTYTIVFWVQETQYDQNESDGGKTFVGKINVTTANGGSGVTGVLSAAGAQNVSP